MLQTLFVIAALLPSAPVPGPAIQERDLEATARKAAYRYESLLRRRAPYGFGSGGGGRCDEVIGRFCFHFTDDEPTGPPDPEHPDIARARLRAVQAFRRWVSDDPSNGDAVGGLVRYLVEDGRAEEAVPVARTHAWADGGYGSQMLMGLALHHAGRTAEAEAVFDGARADMPEAERRRVDAVGMLLAPRERAQYDDLGPREQAEYNRRFWAFSDPALAMPGNERRSGHYARHAWIAVLSAAPRAEGMQWWGDDHAEIVLRYGLPSSREQIRPSGWQLGSDLRMIESYDPRAVTLAPPALVTEGIPPLPAPGASAAEAGHPRSLYTPVRLPRLRPLDIQVTRLPGPDGWILRFDGSLPADTVAPGVPLAPRALVVVLDTLGREVGRAPALVETGPDSLTIVRGEIHVQPGSYVYQLEVVDTATGLAGRSLHRLDVGSDEVRGRAPGSAASPGPGMSDDLTLSDPLLALPGSGVGAAEGREDLTPFPTRVLLPGQVVEVFAQVRGLGRAANHTARYAVEWWLEPLQTPSLVVRAARWLGRTLGLAADVQPVRVRWEAGSDDPDPATLSFTLDLAGVEPGLYRLGLTVTDRVVPRAVSSSRVLRLDPRALAWSPNDGG